MNKFLRVSGLIGTVTSAVFFVLTFFAALLLRNIERKLLDSQAYKVALREQMVYNQVPRVIAEQIKLSLDYSPCQANPFSCEGISPDLRACYGQKIESNRLADLMADRKQPTNQEMNAIQPCIENYGLPKRVNWGDINPLYSAPREVQQCIISKVGAETYDALEASRRSPSAGEMEAIKSCYSQSGITLVTDGPPAVMQNLSVADWEKVINTVAPASELQALTENILDQVFSYLNGKSQTVVLDLTKFKKRIIGPDGIEAIMQFIRSQPACTRQQIAQMDADIANQTGQLTICFPGESLLADWRPLIQDQLQSVVDEVPDERILLGPEQQANQNGLGSLRFIRFSMRIFMVLPLGFLLVITLLVVRSARSWLRWWGIPFFSAGVISLILGAFASGFLNKLQIGLLTGSLPAYVSIGVARLGQDIAVAILHAVTEGVVLGGLLLALLGLGMWIGSYFIKGAKQPPRGFQPPNSEPFPPVTS
jgi:hypothetical protein